MDRSEPFLRTLEDVRMRVATGRRDEYQAIGTAALLPKLLLDDHPLVDQVNRTHRIRLRFVTTRASGRRTPSPATSNAKESRR